MQGLMLTYFNLQLMLINFLVGMCEFSDYSTLIFKLLSLSLHVITCKYMSGLLETIF